MDIFEAEMARRFVVAVEKIANALDRKDENCSEKPNNCENHSGEVTEMVKDEPTTQTETQNSNLTFEKRTMLDCYNCKRFETEDECIECRYEPKDEPQRGYMWTCPKCGQENHSDFESCPCCGWNMIMYYPQVDGITPSVIVKTEPQTTSTPYKVDTSSICKIEPQTDCAWK